jgi:hypothetical protein
MPEHFPDTPEDWTQFTPAPFKPRYHYPEQSPQFTHRQAAAIFAGDTSGESAWGLLRDMTRRGLIYAAARTGEGLTASFLYGPAAIAAAAVLVELRRVGFSRDVQRLVSHHLHTPRLALWPDGSRPDKGHPVIAATRAAASGEPGHVLRIDTAFHDPHPDVSPPNLEPVHRVLIGPPARVSEPWHPIGMTVRWTHQMDLSPVLAPLHARLIAAVRDMPHLIMAAPMMTPA